MNSQLLGKTLLVGRNPEGGRLCIVVDDMVKPLVALLGNQGPVPNSVSRYNKNERMAHCKIVISQSGTMTVVNMKTSNKTFVNGVEVQSKVVKEGAVISLGKDNYEIKVDTILNCASKLIGVAGSKGVGSNGIGGNGIGGNGAGVNVDGGKEIVYISHLENVWMQYKSSKAALKKRQKKISLIKGAYMPIVVLSGILGYLFDFFEWGKSVSLAISMMMYAIAAIFLFYGFYKTYTDHTSEESEALDEDFRRKYVCPKCRRFLGFTPFNEIILNNKCPHCKSIWK